MGNYIGVKVRSRRLAIVISERSAETLSTSDATVGPLRFRDRADELVVEALDAVALERNRDNDR